MTSLVEPSTLTQGTEFKSHSTLQKGSMADSTAALPQRLAAAMFTSTTDVPPHTSAGPLSIRKLELDQKKMGSTGHPHGIAKATNIQNLPIEGAHT